MLVIDFIEKSVAKIYGFRRSFSRNWHQAGVLSSENCIAQVLLDDAEKLIAHLPLKVLPWCWRPPERIQLAVSAVGGRVRMLGPRARRVDAVQELAGDRA